MASRVPPKFDERFLAWFRDRTEAAWEHYEPRDFSGDGPGGVDWQPGTRWTDGLSEKEIERAETKLGLCLPPDYRLFLARLHVPDRPMTGWLFRGRRKVRASEQPFSDWRRPADIRGRLRARVDGVLFDVEHNAFWLRSWGLRPGRRADRARLVRARAAAGVPLAPLYFHRCLPCVPCRAGNPVLSIHQTDIIFYGADLRSWMLVEFANLLGLDRDRQWNASSRTISHRFQSFPFWGPVALQHGRDVDRRAEESRRAVAEWKAKVARGEIREPEPATAAERMIAAMEKELEAGGGE